MVSNDKDRRYEIRVNPSPWGDPVCGWNDEEQLAIKMANAIVKHPEIREAWVVDRQDANKVVFRVAKTG